MSKFPSDSLRLIEFIGRSIEESGHCTIGDRKVLGLLSSITDTCEAKIRRLRLFARQHDWSVASHLGRTAVFKRRLNGLMPVLKVASHQRRLNYAE